MSDNTLEKFNAALDANDHKTSILRRLKEFVDIEQDDKLTDPMDLVSALYKRVRLEDDIRRVEESNSWDYCKVTAIDFYKRTPRWIPIHEDAFWYQIGCVPPRWQGRGLTMCGEPYSGDYHLTRRDDGDRFYCCLLTRRQIDDDKFMTAIPVADMPMLGVPKEEEVGA